MRIKHLLLLILLCFLTPSYLVAQDSTKIRNNIFKRIYTDSRNTVLTIGHTYAAPFHWQKKDLLMLGGVLVISGASMFIDEPVDKLMQRNQTRNLNRIERVGDFLGQPENNYPIMLFVWASGVLVNNDWLRDTGIMIAASVTSSGIIQSISKEAVGRSRPVFGRGAFDFKPFGGADYHSFPSGHTMLSVATSWILARQVNFMPLKIVFYALPVITGASRIYTGAHWLSDILLGSALGIACAESVLRLYPLIKKNKDYAMTMTASGNGIGIAINF
jgi:hypothetical protein